MLFRISQSLAVALAVAAAVPAAGQDPQPAESSAYLLLSADGRRSLQVRRVGGEDLVTLADLATVFPFTVREDALAGGLTVTLGGQTIVLAPGQTLASVGGRLITLPAPATREGSTWLVPIEFVSRALGPISGTRVDLRKSSRLIMLGELRVPRVAVRVDAENSRARLTVEADPVTRHRVTQEEGRLVVGFDADAIDARLGALTPGALVQALHADQGSARLVVDLGPAFGSYRTSDVPGGEGFSRFVIELIGTQPEPPPAGPPPGVPETSPPAPAPDAPPPLDLSPAATLRTVVIDPGHGGAETGARGVRGTLEKDITLQVAQRLKSAIEGRLGLRVLLTRDGDQTVGLDERAARANNNKADLFISLHANASPRASTEGAEVFYLSLDEYGSEGERAARGEGVSLPVFGGGSRNLELILWEMAQARYVEESAQLASIVEEELRQRVPMSSRAIQQAPFRVLVGANMPAVLVELGFITNPAEETRLASESFQAAVVQALLESILRFRAYLRASRETQPIAAQGPVGRLP